MSHLQSIHGHHEAAHSLMHWVKIKPEESMVWILGPSWPKNSKEHKGICWKTSKSFSEYVCDRIKFCESNKVKGMFYKHTSLHLGDL